MCMTSTAATITTSRHDHHGHDHHDHDHSGNVAATYDDDIRAWSLRLDRPVDAQR